MTGFPTQAFANLVILLLTIPLALAAWRLVRGPGVAASADDRLRPGDEEF